MNMRSFVIHELKSAWVCREIFSQGYHGLMVQSPRSSLPCLPFMWWDKVSTTNLFSINFFHRGWEKPDTHNFPRRAHDSFESILAPQGHIVLSLWPTRVVYPLWNSFPSLHMTPGHDLCLPCEILVFRILGFFTPFNLKNLDARFCKMAYPNQWSDSL
jgi:hypothetical protein